MRTTFIGAVAVLAVATLPGVASAQWLRPEPVSPPSAFKLDSAPPTQFAPRQNTFTKIAGDLYRAGDGTWFMGVLVTPDGILLVDTLNPPFAKWLKQQLAERFPGKQVKYVIYSHTHWDHIDGSNLFSDTAKFIAQENALKNLDGRYPHMPGDMGHGKGFVAGRNAQEPEAREVRGLGELRAPARVERRGGVLQPEDL